MKRIHTSFLLIVLVSLFALACNRNMNQASGNQSDAADELAEERQQLSNDIRAGIANLNAKLDKVNKELENASEDAKAKWREEAKNLERDRAKLNGYLEQAGRQTKSKWQAFKAEVRTAVDRINDDPDDDN